MADRTAWLFPGQGSQGVGMGKALADAFDEARRTFEEANAALGFDLRRLCWEGPEDELARTANAQPAILTASIAALRAARARGLREDGVLLAGHSLGEFTALVAGEALAFADALRLVRRRGELMQAADASGGMAAVIGLDAEAVDGAIRETGVVVANDNAPGQIVLSGDDDALTGASRAARESGLRAMKLGVAGAFHSPAMAPAVPEFESALRDVEFRAPAVPVVSCTTAEPMTDPRRDLAAALIRPVRWADTMRALAVRGAGRFADAGPGRVLAKLARRNLPGAEAVALTDLTLEPARG